jgi:hypothetical protein
MVASIVADPHKGPQDVIMKTLKSNEMLNFSCSDGYILFFMKKDYTSLPDVIFLSG